MSCEIGRSDDRSACPIGKSDPTLPGEALKRDDRPGQSRSSVDPGGVLAITGCITRANGGNAVRQLIGMIVGASYLGVHVVALSGAKDGSNSVDMFDIHPRAG
jgi:hypothetical protein